MHNNPNKAEKCAESRCFWFTVAVSCECFRRSHSAVVCGGWHLALRHSCLPPPLLSALQWDHVVLLISQQWLYSLHVPLFSAFLSLYISSSPLVFISSLTSTCGRLTDYFPLLTSCHINSMNSISSKANSNPCLSTTLRPLTELLGALAVARQLSEFHKSIEVSFGSYGHSWGSEKMITYGAARINQSSAGPESLCPHQPVRAFS